MDKSTKVFLIILMVLLAFIVAGGWYVSKGYAQKIDWQTYKPTYLPKGISITDSELIVNKQRGTFASFSKHLNTNLSVENSWFAQWEDDDSILEVCSDEYSKEDISYKDCKALATNQGQKYLLSVFQSRDGYYNYSAHFIKNDTRISITIAEYNKNISEEEWDKIIDSFQQADFDNVKKTIYTNQPI